MNKFSVILAILAAVVTLTYAGKTTKKPGTLDISTSDEGAADEIDFLKLFKDVKDDSSSSGKKNTDGSKLEANKNRPAGKIPPSQKSTTNKPIVKPPRKTRQSQHDLSKKPNNSTKTPTAAGNATLLTTKTSKNSTTPQVTTTTPKPQEKKSSKSSGVFVTNSIVFGFVCLAFSYLI